MPTRAGASSRSASVVRYSTVACSRAPARAAGAPWHVVLAGRRSRRGSSIRGRSHADEDSATAAPALCDARRRTARSRRGGARTPRRRSPSARLDGHAHLLDPLARLQRRLELAVEQLARPGSARRPRRCDARACRPRADDRRRQLARPGRHARCSRRPSRGSGSAGCATCAAGLAQHGQLLGDERRVLEPPRWRTSGPERTSASPSSPGSRGSPSRTVDVDQVRRRRPAAC